MHEYGLCEGIVASVRHRAAGRRVGRVVVRIGVRHAALPAPMAQAFEEVTAGTEVSGARLEIVPVPLRLVCRACDASGDTSDPLALCPGCGGDRVDLSGGDELTLVQIEYLGAGPAAGPAAGLAAGPVAGTSAADLAAADLPAAAGLLATAGLPASARASSRTRTTTDPASGSPA